MTTKQNLVHPPLPLSKNTKIILIFLFLVLLLSCTFAYKYVKEYRQAEKVTRTMAQLADFSSDTTGQTQTAKKCTLQINGVLSPSKTLCRRESAVGYPYNPSYRKETIAKLNSWLLAKDFQTASPSKSKLACTGVFETHEGNDLNAILNACNGEYKSFLNETITPVNPFEYVDDPGYDFTLVDMPEVEITIYRSNIVIRVSSDPIWEIFT